MQIDKSQPLGPRQPDRSDPLRTTARPGSAAPSTGPRDVYEGRTESGTSPAGPDSIELSSAGRRAQADHLPGPTGLESPAARAERLATLAHDLAEGRLFSAERLARAASRLLGGE